MSRMGIMVSLRRSPLSRVSFACVTRFPFTYLPYTEEKAVAPMPRMFEGFKQSTEFAGTEKTGRSSTAAFGRPRKQVNPEYKLVFGCAQLRFVVSRIQQIKRDTRILYAASPRSEIRYGVPGVG